MDIPQDIIDNIIAAVGDVTRLLKQCSLVFPSLKQELRSEATNLARGFTKFSSKIQPFHSSVRDITLPEYIDCSDFEILECQWMNSKIPTCHSSTLDLLSRDFLD